MFAGVRLGGTPEGRESIKVTLSHLGHFVGDRGVSADVLIELDISRGGF